MFVSSLLLTPLSLLPPIWTSDVPLLPLFPLPLSSPYCLTSAPCQSEVSEATSDLARWRTVIRQAQVHLSTFYSTEGPRDPFFVLLTLGHFPAIFGWYLFLLETLLRCLAGPLPALGTLLARGYPHTLATSALMGAPTLVWRSCVHLLPRERAALGYLEESSQCSFSFYFWFLTDPSTNHCKLSFAFL